MWSRVGQSSALPIGYSPTFLPRLGIECTYVDAEDPDGWERAIEPKTRMLFVETPTNPGLDIIDLALLGDVARDKDLILVVDNCFATPVLQRPIELGAHLVIHSATKFIDGQGRVLGGAVMGRTDLVDDIYAFCPCERSVTVPVQRMGSLQESRGRST